MKELRLTKEESKKAKKYELVPEKHLCIRENYFFQKKIDFGTGVDASLWIGQSEFGSNRPAINLSLFKKGDCVNTNQLTTIFGVHAIEDPETKETYEVNVIAADDSDPDMYFDAGGTDCDRFLVIIPGPICRYNVMVRSDSPMNALADAAAYLANRSYAFRPISGTQYVCANGIRVPVNGTSILSMSDLTKFVGSVSKKTA